MNRCLFSAPHTRLRCLPLLCVLGALAFSQVPLAHAQQAMSYARNFPAAALRGAMVVTQPPEILMNGQPERLSPGARIHDVGNTLVLSASLTGNPYLVNYLREPGGLIREVWILTPDEAALTLPTQPVRVYGAPTDNPNY